MASASSTQADEGDASELQETIILPATLKFVIADLKSVIQTPLNADNYAIWRSQILKIFKANGFDSFLDPNISPPDKQISSSEGVFAPNPRYNRWMLQDQNLAAAMCSTISPSILPYVINLGSTSEIWSILETRFQSSNRSKVIQLKNALHNIAFKNSSMTQYLTEIKTLVDQIAAAGSQVDTEDIILYTLNGLPSSYQSFKVKMSATWSTVLIGSS